MRVRDWSSDVCSSDLGRRRGAPLRLQAFELLGAEARLQRLDALEDRRVRGEQAAESDAVAEQHVADLLGLAAVGQLRALVDTRDLLQRAGQAGRLAGELPRRPVVPPFARAAVSRL